MRVWVPLGTSDVKEVAIFVCVGRGLVYWNRRLRVVISVPFGAHGASESPSDEALLSRTPFHALFDDPEASRRKLSPPFEGLIFRLSAGIHTKKPLKSLKHTPKLLLI